MRILLLTLGFLLSWTSLPAQTDAEQLDAANRAYSEGHYDEAVRQFQQLIQARGYSAPLCFDLGNAESKAGHTGQAILNYERARYLAPADHDIDHNLQLERQQAGLQGNSLRWWQVVLRALTINQWLLIVDSWLGLIALAVLANAVAARLAAGLHLSEPVLRRTIKTVLFIGIPCFLFFAYVALLAAPLRIEGVVTAKDTILRISPFDASEQIGTLAEGELVTVEQKHDDYIRIEARGGRYGWMQRAKLEPVIAGSFDTPAAQ